MVLISWEIEPDPRDCAHLSHMENIVETHPVIKMLIDDHFAGLSGSEEIRNDRQFMEEFSPEFYVVSVAEAQELVARHFGYLKALSRELDDVCARIGFLRTTNALARKKLGKSWRPARIIRS